MPGSPRNADGQSKSAKKPNFRQLVESEITEIPPMPNPHNWINMPSFQSMKRKKEDQALLESEGIDPDAEPEFDDDDIDWAQPVKDWWVDIWSSPMANEFVDSDIHGLYLACYYFNESLNAFYKPGDRIAWAKQFENSIKNYGLTPSARESLRWQVAQGTAAQSRTNQLRAAVSAGQQVEDYGDLYTQYG